ncbi:EAL domain-containing protein [Pseudoalteromonas sp.]|uniref:EAL domain-containing protein n=1 Tax=Pseudoalteromonas sp. TaxID=53249 RepID=UPI001BCC9BF9|nr:EAL domain-containing protein [Pseudoalteromonas sp.]
MGMRINEFITAIFVLFVLISVDATAQVKRLSPSEGLSQSYVNTMLIDNNGYLWLSTEGGLNRYDGYQVVPINGPNGELEEAVIDRIYQDPQGHIWIASLLAGLFRYDPQTDTYQQFLEKPLTEEQIIQQSVFTMLATDDETLWIGQGQEFAKLDIDSGTITSLFKLPEQFDNAFVRTLFHHDGYIFIGSTDGAYVFNIATQQVRSLEHLNETNVHIYQNNVKSFALGENHQLLVGTVKGLYAVDISNLAAMFNNREDVFKNKKLLADLNVWDIDNQQGVLDLATDKGLLSYNLTTSKVVKNTRIQQSKYTLADNSIIDMVKDKSGGVWLATKTDGAFYLSGDEYKFHNIEGSTLVGDGLSHHSVWAIKEYQDKLWLGTHNGLTAIDLKINSSKVYLKDYKADLLTTEFTIFKILPYKNKLWLHSNRGLFIFDPQTEQLTQPKTANPNNQVFLNDWMHGITLLPNGDLYFVHPDHGMFKYNIDRRRLVHLKGELAQFDPFLVYGFLPPLSDKPQWPLFFSGGVLYQFNPNDLSLNTIYKVPKHHDNVAVNILSYIEDKQGILWLSLSNFGLIGIDATTYELVHTIDLDKNNLGTLLYDMVLDEEGMIWMSSHKGIWRLNPKTIHFQQFTTSDGVLSAEFNNGAMAKLADGKIAYGSLKGITYFDPKDNKNSHGLLDHVNITRINLMSRNLSINLQQPLENITLNHDDIGLEIAFSAMSFSFQERIIYEYQLDKGKKSYTRNNRVVFPKLNPGSYQLKVWAKDPLNGKHTPPATLHIKVKYPLWRAPYFLALYAILLFLIVAAWVMRRNKIQRMLLAAHKESQDSEARLKLALEGSESGVWDWQANQLTIYQPRLVNELGFEDDSVSLDDYLEKIHPHERAIFRLEWLEFLSTDKGYFNCTYRLRHAEGHWRWYKDFGKVVEWNKKIPQKVAGTYTNMTREMVLEEHARLFTAAFEQTRDWVFILDKNFNIRASNKSLQSAFGLSENPKSTRSLNLGITRSSCFDYLRIMQKLEVGEHFSCEDTVVLANKEQRHVLVEISVVADESQRLSSYVIILTDIHAQKSAENQLHILANFDSLTGLPNRTLFKDRAMHAIDQARRHHCKVALLHVNIKRFKYFNDSFGTLSADEIIKWVANRLKTVLRPCDSVARLGGDEFAILVEDIQQIEEVLLICNKLIECVSEGIVINKQSVTVHLSAGVAIFPDDAVHFKALQKASNVALYYAKESLEGSYKFYKQEMNQRVERALHLESQLFKAYHEHEFCNYYQPIINATTQKTVGFEVLLRWPDNPLANTQAFSSMAENIGLITKIMLQTLKRALDQLGSWRVVCPDLYLSINLSALDFEFSGLVPEIRQALSNAALPPEAIVFEITESILMQDSAHALKNMNLLKQLGCKLYMDDFGTGYASLTYLKRFPIDVLKIDRSFVQGIGIDSDNEAIIQSTLTLASRLGKECIAEGVESAHQLAFLKAQGCNYFQGYLFSKAVPKEQVLKLIELDWQPVFSHS